ncbi:hypothetical protein J5N97_030262 [Dioscorea zingiberensis]|uniref:Anaphase-promoting complex subunit 4-like WD40 domain-containing protein n=1 Tax=Dioscorea zingiberensis TaxID=325984 RepID=A0A9D5H430_9LILI|nr:hypothetical protein J5N97_030262 [Dioscorea zingiberensis]
MLQVWNASNYNLVGSLPTTMDVRSIVTNAELLYLGGKMGTVEIRSREKLNEVLTLQTGTSGKVQCMAIDSDGELLVVGTSDGKIQVLDFAGIPDPMFDIPIFCANFFTIPRLSIIVL